MLCEKLRKIKQRSNEKISLVAHAYFMLFELHYFPQRLSKIVPLCAHTKKRKISWNLHQPSHLNSDRNSKRNEKNFFLGSQRITLNEASLSLNEHLSGVEKLMEEKNYLQCNPFMTFPRKLFMFCRKEIWKSEP